MRDAVQARSGAQSEPPFRHQPPTPRRCSPTSSPARPTPTSAPPWPSPPHPHHLCPLQPATAASAAPRGPRPRPSPRARPSRAGANASIVPAISPHFVSTCKRARARSKGMCGGEVACTSTRKSGVPATPRIVAQIATPLSLIAPPSNAASRHLPERRVMSACAQAQACRTSRCACRPQAGRGFWAAGARMRQVRGGASWRAYLH